MNKRDQIPQLFYVVEGINDCGECIKRIPAYGATKQDAGNTAMGHAQGIIGKNGIVDTRILWAGKADVEVCDREPMV